VKRRETFQESWHCLRCLHEWEIKRPVDYDLVRPVEADCPKCGGDAELGELPAIESEDWPCCCECGRVYAEFSVTAGDWETSDMESPVCPSCIREWTQRGAGYYRCSGCGKRILARTPVCGSPHMVPVAWDSPWRECGTWIREEARSPSADCPPARRISEGQGVSA